jgi:hypothetical protein
MPHRHAALPPLVLLVLLAACVPQPVAWEGVSRTEGALADSLTLALDVGTTPVPRFEPRWVPASWPVDGAACTRTRRAAFAPAAPAYASWFAIRPDSSVVLKVARSDDRGLSWLPAVVADSTDVGRTGCSRDAPYISVDSASGYVHVVYHLVAREGAGIFFAHSMDGGALFHEPVPIVYGDRPGAASVASDGDVVAVAFEDPNSRMPRLGLALSVTQGHIFERRAAVSDETGEARTPRIAVRDGRVAIAWTTTQRGGALPRTALRVGTILPLEER